MDVYKTLPFADILYLKKLSKQTSCILILSVHDVSKSKLENSQSHLATNKSEFTEVDEYPLVSENKENLKKRSLHKILLTDRCKIFYGIEWKPISLLAEFFGNKQAFIDKTFRLVNPKLVNKYFFLTPSSLQIDSVTLLNEAIKDSVNNVSFEVDENELNEILPMSSIGPTLSPINEKVNNLFSQIGFSQEFDDMVECDDLIYTSKDVNCDIAEAPVLSDSWLYGMVLSCVEVVPFTQTLHARKDFIVVRLACAEKKRIYTLIYSKNLFDTILLESTAYFQVKLEKSENLYIDYKRHKLVEVEGDLISWRIP